MDSRNSMFVLASDVLLAEQQTNNQFMSVKMRMQSTNGNRNDQGVTEAFIDEIVANPEKYDCTPLYADKMNLQAGRYEQLGHKFNRITHTFGTDQIGSFALNSFEKVKDEFGTCLYGEVRIPKRESDICAAVKEMYDKGILCFSFELTYDPDHVIYDGKVMYVDAAETNTLNGMAIVSVPAYPEAVALDQVAEAEAELTDNTEPTQIISETVEKSGTDTNEVNEEMDKVNEANASTVEEVMIDTASEQTVERVSDFEDEPNVAAEANAAVDEKGEEVKPEDNTEEQKKEEASAEEAPANEDEKKEEKPEETPEENKEEAKAEEASDRPPEMNRVIETVEETYVTRITRMQETIAEQESMIASLQEKVKDYDAIQAELNQYKEAAQKMEHDQKLNKATVYAETMGLNVEDEEVKSAIASLDYEKLADLSVAVAQAAKKATEESENKDQSNPVGQIFSSYAGIIDDMTFGGIISGR